MLTFRSKYQLLGIIIFIVEVLIALYVDDKFIRPYLGDVLVVILIYCFVMAFLKLPVVKAAIGVWIFACVIECLQYIKFVSIIGLKNNKLANVVLGNSFSWMDIVAYTAGILIVVIVEQRVQKKQTHS